MSLILNGKSFRGELKDRKYRSRVKKIGKRFGELFVIRNFVRGRVSIL